MAGEERRLQILRVAMRLFSYRGFRGTTTKEIAKAAGVYIRERQHDGAFRDIDTAIVVRSFLGMIIHHSLNNTLWDKTRRILNITNERAASEFTNILLHGITADGGATRTPKSRRRSTI